MAKKPDSSVAVTTAKEMADAAFVVSVLVRVNRSVTLLPAVTEGVKNAILSVGAFCTRKLVEAAVDVVAVPLVILMVLVVMV